MVSLAQEMTFFYTGKGDKGSSHIGKKKYPKDSPIVEALGDLDELNSLLGVVRTQIRKPRLVKKLEGVQENLFIIQARIAWLMYPKFSSPQMTEKKIKAMEQEINAIEKKIQPKRGFVISGFDPVASWLDMLRAVSRRAERRVVKLHKTRALPQEIITYLNRLSSYFYALARVEISAKKIKEPNPTYK
ncbi:MAG: cob(I)yrinic acid a,c-diamide adenosyltransferase [Candidatus Wildermuthbacteria bacterium]|nr:cob(I)yrinic acid a,c-diamide adenosyltransferase [Candidatus Wildermuthbacteria bacterium]